MQVSCISCQIYVRFMQNLCTLYAHFVQINFMQSLCNLYTTFCILCRLCAYFRQMLFTVPAHFTQDLCTIYAQFMQFMHNLCTIYTIILLGHLCTFMPGFCILCQFHAIHADHSAFMHFMHPPTCWWRTRHFMHPPTCGWSSRRKRLQWPVLIQEYVQYEMTSLGYEYVLSHTWRQIMLNSSLPECPHRSRHWDSADDLLSTVETTKPEKVLCE